MDNCVFCKLIEENSSSIIVNEEEFVLIKDENPDAKVHLLALPKHHYSNIYDAEASDFMVLTKIIKYVSEHAQGLGLEKGCRFVMNNGAQATQTMFHAHLHILGGQKLKHMQKN